MNIFKKFNKFLSLIIFFLNNFRYFIRRNVLISISERGPIMDSVKEVCQLPSLKDIFFITILIQ